MRLFEHEDFRDAVTQAAADRGIPEPLVEKDYYVTEVLRLVAGSYGSKVIFKGGTSLSKGWNLIERFSEDVDLLVVRQRFAPPLSRTGADHQLAAMRDLVAGHPGLSWQEQDSEKFGQARLDTYRYAPRFERPGLPATVRTEPGIAGGDHPTSELDIESMVASFLREQGQEDMAEDTSAFAVTTLHFRRTFVEKLFVVHALVARMKDDGEPLGRDARHYYDLHALAPRSEVKEMLASEECQQIKRDCQAIGLKFFRNKYKEPSGLSFAKSDGVFPPSELRTQIERDYTAECQRLCYGDIPTFAEVMGRLEELRDLL